jgi:hypothetical protein
MRGEYDGKNGNRDFLGEGNGCGIAWDPGLEQHGLLGSLAPAPATAPCLLLLLD